MEDALALINKVIEDDRNHKNVHLYVLRARIHMKYSNVMQLITYFNKILKALEHCINAAQANSLRTAETRCLLKYG